MHAEIMYGRYLVLMISILCIISDVVEGHRRQRICNPPCERGRCVGSSGFSTCVCEEGFSGQSCNIEVYTCDDGSNFGRGQKCNYIWDCSNGMDELHCAPDLIEGSQSFQHPSTESGTWKFQVEGGLGIHIKLTSNNSKGQLLFGEGSTPETSVLNHDRHMKKNVDILLPGSIIWVVYKTSDEENNGIIDIHVKSIASRTLTATNLTNGEFSSPEYPNETIHDWAGLWMYRFPTDMGGFIKCDVLLLSSGPTIEIGAGNLFNSTQSVVTLRDHYAYNSAEIQIPHETIWIRAHLEGDINNDGSDRRGSRFHCTISAVMATIKLLMDESVNIDYSWENEEAVWIGWKLEAPPSFATVFSFSLDEDSFESSLGLEVTYPEVGIGLNFERSVVSEYSFSATEMRKDIAFDQSAWTFISSSYCSDVCHLFYSVSAMAREDIVVCDNKMVVIRERRCNGVYDCRDGRDERGCRPLSAGQKHVLAQPSHLEHTSVTIWLLVAEPESFFVLEVPQLSNKIRYLAVGTGYYPSDTSTIIAQWQPKYQYENIRDQSVFVQSNMMWIKMEGYDSGADESPGHVVISRVNDITVTSSTEFSSPGYPEEVEHDWIGLWIFRFPEGAAGLVKCDEVSLDSDQTIEIGIGDAFQSNLSIVTLERWYNIAEIQVPYKTIWIRANLQTTHFHYNNYYNYYGYDIGYFYDGSRFHCSVSAVNATHLLQPEEPVEIDIETQFTKFIWIGWLLKTPESFATVIRFVRENVSGADVGAGINFEKSVTPEYSFSSQDFKTPVIAINGSAWTFVSSKFCLGVCQLSYEVVAVALEDTKICDGYFYTAEDMCNNITTCLDGTDENGCVTARLEGNDSITLYPSLYDPTNIVWSVIVQDGFHPLLRVKNRDIRYRNRLEIGEGLFQAGNYPLATFSFDSDYFDSLIPSQAAWIRYHRDIKRSGYPYGFELEITAANPDELHMCRDSVAVFDDSEVCNGQPYCPYGGDEIGCEIVYNGKNTTLLTKGYPIHLRSGMIQMWEYYTTGVQRTMIVHFRDLLVSFTNSEFYAGTGRIPGNYRKASVFHYTRGSNVKDFILQSSRMWIIIEGTSKMWAEIRVVKPSDEIIRCNDGKHIAALDQLCDNRWTCETGEDEVGCDALSLEAGERLSIDIPIMPYIVKHSRHSWTFRTQQEKSAFVFSPISQSHNFGMDKITIGKGTDITNTASVRYSKSTIWDDVVYVKGGEAWFYIRTTSVRMTVNVTTVHLSAKELYLCKGSDHVISREKLCDNAWDCPSGSDESNCEPTFINERDNFKLSLFRPSYSNVVTYSWVFNVSDGREASINFTHLQVYRAQISMGTGLNPSDVDTRLVTLTDETDQLNWKISSKRFWVKTVIKVDAYKRLYGYIKITSVLQRTSACTTDEFQCTVSRECISRQLTCNERYDCQDRSDENTCGCESPLEVQCGTGECISRSSICREGSSTNYVGCLDEKVLCVFECPAFRGLGVISARFICDGYQDCVDGSDEEVEKCECKPPAYSCEEKCITSNQVCDGKTDCQDGRDEQYCECSSFEVPHEEAGCIAYWELNRCSGGMHPHYTEHDSDFSIIPTTVADPRNDDEDAINVFRARYLVRIRSTFGGTCGGSLINDRWVLTAAECLDKMLFPRLPTPTYEVLVGINDFPRYYTESDVYSAITVTEVIISTGIPSGFALLKLDRTVDGFGNDVTSISLPQQGRGIPPGTYVNVVGWTQTPLDGEADAIINIIREPIVPEELCMNQQHPSRSMGDVFCTGYIQSYKADCYNIHGGPVFQEIGDGGRHEIIGVVVGQQSSSWQCGQLCALKMFPLVSSLVELIEDIMRVT